MPFKVKYMSQAVALQRYWMEAYGYPTLIEVGGQWFALTPVHLNQFHSCWLEVCEAFVAGSKSAF